MPELAVHRGWRPGGTLLAALHGCFAYGPGDDRATGYLWADGEQDWPVPFADHGPQLLADLQTCTGQRYTICAFQAYRDGAGCGWHADSPFGAQAILSLGVTRTFGVRRTGGEPEWLQVAAGDLVVMPDGFQRDWEHCIPVEEDIHGERCSLVFRTRAEVADG